MKHISLTPFGRQPVTAGQLATHARASAAEPCLLVNKWQVLRDLTRARKAYGLSDRDLSVLHALVSFWPNEEIGSGLSIVFPSNATLSTRAHGMAESTLRRHLAALVTAGVIRRHDSPNGKRYARGNVLAFGFDLSPLAHLSDAITEHAETIRAEEIALTAQREEIVLRLRDCDKFLFWLVEQAISVPQTLFEAVLSAKKALRRKAQIDALNSLGQTVNKLWENVQGFLPKTEDMSGTAVKYERHKQDSDIILNESESGIEIPSVDKPAPIGPDNLPWELVLKACPDIAPYAKDDIRNWRDLEIASDFACQMMGIDQSTLNHAKRAMTAQGAATALACILQRFTQITSPGAYLRRLAQKAEAKLFSPLPMVMALLKAKPS